MTIPVWPKINYLVNQGTGTLTLSDGKGRVTSSLDSGQSRTRRRFTRSISPLSSTIHMKYAELALFEYFYKEVLKDGALWFYMPIQRGGAYEINLVMFDPGSNPSASEAGYDAVDVAMNLLVRGVTLISRDVYDYFATLGYADGSAVSDVVTNFVNNVYPVISSEYR